MAGVTDRPFRQLCKKLGAGYAVSEMAASNPKLWDSVKTSRRLNHDGEIAPISVQIAGADPAMMAEAAVFNAGKGARIIDINMGCPVKKVCNVASGSALLRHEDLNVRILDAGVAACAPLAARVRASAAASRVISGDKLAPSQNICSPESLMSRKFDYLGDVEVFLAVVEHGSFTAGAVALSTTPSVLSRAVTRLEARLGRQLLQRTTRRVGLTDAGRLYLEQVRTAFGLLDDAERAVLAQDGARAGRGRLSVPTTYGHYRWN
ncbi:hypothetical protein G6F57_018313 [Rhizopus arrhizus]|nr:hypothetical protein G6F57_018313 [Rhizopus arrhizus]